jgi:hypothetical protein
VMASRKSFFTNGADPPRNRTPTARIPAGCRKTGDDKNQ